MIPGKIFTSFSEFPGIVSVNDFWFPIRAPGTFAAMDQKSFRASPDAGSESGSDVTFSSNWGDPVSKWMFSVPGLLQRILVVHLRLGR